MSHQQENPSQTLLGRNEFHVDGQTSHPRSGRRYLLWPHHPERTQRSTHRGGRAPRTDSWPLPRRAPAGLAGSPFPRPGTPIAPPETLFHKAGGSQTRRRVGMRPARASTLPRAQQRKRFGSERDAEVLLRPSVIHGKRIEGDPHGRVTCFFLWGRGAASPVRDRTGRPYISAPRPDFSRRPLSLRVGKYGGHDTALLTVNKPRRLEFGSTLFGVANGEWHRHACFFYLIDFP